MATKRARSDADSAHQPTKKAKTGFSVAPANLPDGTYKRKAQKIKKDLIDKAKAKRAYAKIKAREGPPRSRPTYGENVTADISKDGAEDDDELQSSTPRSTENAAFDVDDDSDDEPINNPDSTQEKKHLDTEHPKHNRRPRQNPYYREEQKAQRDKEAAEARSRDIERANKERAQKREERERWKRAMAKARTGGKNGQRKLGRESNVLLEKVKRLVGESG